MVEPPDCLVDQGARCVPAAPAGWEGPGRFHYGTVEEDPGGCPAKHEQPFGLLRSPTFTGSTVTCVGDCTCTSQCLVEPILYNSADDCTGSQTGSIPQVVNACVPAEPEAAQGIQVEPPTPFCLVDDTQTPVNSDPVPDLVGRLCSAPEDASGCGAGEVCIGANEPPYPSSLCIWRSGDVPCPPTFPVRETVYAGPYLDTRDCQCSCNFPTCTGLTTVYAASCDGAPLGSIPHDGTCLALTGGPYEAKATVIKDIDPCTTTNGPTGEVEVDPNVEMTVCCE